MRWRSRFIRITAAFASFLLVGLVVRYVTAAPRPPVRIQAPEKPAPPIDAPTKGAPDDSPTAPELPVVLDEGPPRVPSIGEPPAGLPGTSAVAVATPNAVTAFSPDPVQSADEFVARTRKEASDAVDALNKEAVALRERLAKVEAGLARYRAILDALNAGQPPRDAKADPFRPSDAAPVPPSDLPPPPLAPTPDGPARPPTLPQEPPLREAPIVPPSPPEPPAATSPAAIPSLPSEPAPKPEAHEGDPVRS